MPALGLTDTAEMRQHLVGAGVDAFRAHGYRSTGVADIAKAAGYDVQTVESLFPSWDLLLIAILDRWAVSHRRATIDVAESDGAVAYVRALLAAAAADPALIGIRLTLLAEASDPANPGRGWYRTQYAQFVQDVALFFTRDIVAKREPRRVAPRHAAEQLLALYEGLQLQSTLLESVDLLAAWDRAVARLRIGWAEPAAS